MLDKYLAVQNKLSEWLGQLICGMVLIMVAVLLFEIVARYIFGSPTEWAHESSTMLYGSYCILAGAYTMRLQGHVKSEVLYGQFSDRMRGLIDVLTQALTLGCMLVFFKLSVEFALESWQAQEYSSKSTWQPVIYPFKTVIPVAVGLIILQLLAEIIQSMMLLFGLSSSLDAGRSRNDHG